jgi:hypothetical protein
MLALVVYDSIHFGKQKIAHIGPVASDQVDRRPGLPASKSFPVGGPSHGENPRDGSGASCSRIQDQKNAPITSSPVNSAEMANKSAVPQQQF